MEIISKIGIKIAVLSLCTNTNVNAVEIPFAMVYGIEASSILSNPRKKKSGINIEIITATKYSIENNIFSLNSGTKPLIRNRTDPEHNPKTALAYIVSPMILSM